MDLKTLAAAAGEVVTSDGKKIPVRGISLSDISELVKNFRGNLSGVFDAVSASDDLHGDDIRDMLRDVIETAPNLVGQIIALATDSPGQEEEATKLPTGLQLAILEEVGKQTFVTDGGLGKTLEIVINMMSGATKAFEDLNAPKA
jgi:hypothetical protein